MLDALLLYGSRARGDSDVSSDTDLIGIANSGQIEKLYDQSTVSLHIYPYEWLSNQSNSGSIFLLHLVKEAISIFDPNNLMDEIRASFKYKLSYDGDIETGCRVIAAVINMDDRNFSAGMRKKYFWGLRTAIMARAASQQSPTFSAEGLQTFCGISGLAHHIHNRRVAGLRECREIGERVLNSLGDIGVSVLNDVDENNLRTLFDFGGVGTATAGEIIYGF